MKTAYCLFPVSILRCRFFRLGKKKQKNSGVLTWYQQGISKYPESELINTLS